MAFTMNTPVNLTFENNRNYTLPFGYTETVVAATTIITLCVFGIIANLLSIITIAKTKSLQTPFYFLILSLSVSDLLSAVVSPLGLNRLTWGYDRWQWPDFLCKIFWGVDNWTSFVTSLHILSFTTLRFIFVQWPHWCKSFTLNTSKIFVTVVWVVEFLTGFIPFFVWLGATDIDRGNPNVPNQFPSCVLPEENIIPFVLYAEASYPLFFYIPMLLVIGLTILIHVRMAMLKKNWKSMRGMKSSTDLAIELERKRREDNQRLFQLTLVVGSFLLGYVPRTANHFYATSRPMAGFAPYNWWFSFADLLLLRFSECLNPIFYNLASSKNNCIRFSECSTAKKSDNCVKKYITELTHF